jgi:hypothetical protein
VDRAKREAPVLEATVEDEFVYPFLRGREVVEWSSQGAAHVLMPHTIHTRMAPVPMDEMRQIAPLTLAYFENFREILAERKGFTAWEKQYLENGFYAVQRVGDYTFARYKVVWRYISKSFMCAVVHGSEKPVIPNEKLMLIGCEDSGEAYFVCGVLSSSVVRASIEARMVSTQIAPYLIEGIRIPKWNPGNYLHREISSACREGHGGADLIANVMPKVDALASELFGLKQRHAELARTYISLKPEP